MSGHVPTAGLYREAARLLARGLIEVIPTAKDVDPRRHQYVITGAGCAVFDEWVAAEEADDDLLARVVFFDLLRQDTRLRLLRRWEKQLERQIAGLRDRLETRHATQGSPVTAVAIRRNIRHLEAEIGFLEDARRTAAPTPAGARAAIG